MSIPPHIRVAHELLYRMPDNRLYADVLKVEIEQLRHALTSCINASDQPKIVEQIAIYALTPMERKPEEQTLGADARTEEQRCAECDCERGGKDCNWIKPKEQ